MKFLVLAAILAVVCSVAGDIKFPEIARAEGAICKPRTNATDSDIELIANDQAIETDIQKNLLLCILQRGDIFCGEYLKDIAYLSWYFVTVKDGDASQFVNITMKLTTCYNRAKEVVGPYGYESVVVLYDCLRDWMARHRQQPVFTECKP